MPNLMIMKMLFLFPAIAVQFFTADPSVRSSSIFQTDTTTIIHSLDGNIEEWPADIFTTDEATKIRYAVDNNDQILFLAIKIPENVTQKKIMQQGMKLFIDTKGKKREGRGVEFPLKTETAASIDNMRVFGLGNSSELVQSIKIEGTINIAIAWDSSFKMNIEYNIPLKMLENSITELNNKKISIGWKIDEPDMPGNGSQPVRTTSRLVAVPVPEGSTPVISRTARPNQSSNEFPQSSTNKSKSFWTTYTIIL